MTRREKRARREERAKGLVIVDEPVRMKLEEMQELKDRIWAACGPKPTHQAELGTLRAGDVIRCSNCDGLHEVQLLVGGMPCWACPKIERDVGVLLSPIVVQVVLRAEERCNGPDCPLDCPGTHGGCVP